jgi:hypothetical protein
MFEDLDQAARIFSSARSKIGLKAGRSSDSEALGFLDNPVEIDKQDATGAQQQQHKEPE